MQASGEISPEPAPSGRRPAPPELLQRSPLRAIVRLGAPTTGVMLVATTSNVLHTYFVSRLGAEAIAAVALVFPISMILMTVMAGGVGAGVASAIARALGAGRVQDAVSIAEHAFVVAAVLAVAFTVGFEAGIARLFAAMGGEGEVLRQATLFARVLFAGLVFSFTISTFDSIMRGEGNVRVPAIWATVSLLLQIVLTPLFMFVFHLGLVGAPVATLTGQLLAAFPRGRYVFGGHGAVRPRLLPRRLSRQPIAEILRIGIPASVAAAINYVGITVMTSVFAHFGTAHLAAYGLGSRLDFLLFTLGYGVAAACLTLVGMAVGAGRADLVTRYVRSAIAVAAGVVLVPAVVVTWYPPAWIGIFTDDPAIRAVGAQYLRTIGPSYLFVITSMVLATSFQGFGRATAPLAVMAARVVLVVGTALLLTRGYGCGAQAVLLVIAVGNIGSMFALSLMFRQTLRAFRRHARISSPTLRET